VPEKTRHDGINTWRFEFEVDDISMISTMDQDLGLLKQDCQNIPMITGLDETPDQTQYLDPDHNILFQA
jgi:hypothetical protein